MKIIKREEIKPAIVALIIIFILFVLSYNYRREIKHPKDNYKNEKTIGDTINFNNRRTKDLFFWI